LGWAASGLEIVVNHTFHEATKEAVGIAAFLAKISRAGERLDRLGRVEPFGCQQ